MAGNTATKTKNTNVTAKRRRVRVRKKAEAPEKPHIAVFDRQNPCTKTHIWNAFRGKRAFVGLSEPEMLARIGENVPRHLMRQGRLTTRKTANNQTQYVLTPEGEDWLGRGLEAQLRRHPEKLDGIENAPKWLKAAAATKAK